MITMITLLTMSKEGRKMGAIAVRMSTDELARFAEIVGRARERNSLASGASVARELLGFPAVPRTITDEDREYFVAGRVEPEEIPVAGRLTRKHEKLVAKLKDILLNG